MTAGAYSIAEVQRLVATLVASKPGGRVAELGTSYGEGAKAILAALPPQTSFVTVEIDPERAELARQALAGSEAEVLEGDWQVELAGRGPFDVVFADGGADYDRVIDLLAPGGILIKDDLTPGRPVEGDATREALLLDDRVEAVEILVTPEMACIVAVRRA
jgi:predicted O-methyltransferase YrrM